MTLEHKIALWERVNEYVATCGGDSSAATISAGRERAVVALENEVEAAVQRGRDESAARIRELEAESGEVLDRTHGALVGALARIDELEGFLRQYGDMLLRAVRYYYDGAPIGSADVTALRSLLASLPQQTEPGRIRDGNLSGWSGHGVDRKPGCSCRTEEGDSPCPVHGAQQTEKGGDADG